MSSYELISMSISGVSALVSLIVAFLESGKNILRVWNHN